MCTVTSILGVQYGSYNAVGQMFPLLRKNEPTLPLNSPTGNQATYRQQGRAETKRELHVNEGMNKGRNVGWMGEGRRVKERNWRKKRERAIVTFGLTYPVA